MPSLQAKGHHHHHTTSLLPGYGISNRRVLTTTPMHSFTSARRCKRVQRQSHHQHRTHSPSELALARLRNYSARGLSPPVHLLTTTPAHIEYHHRSWRSAKGILTIPIHYYHGHSFLLGFTMYCRSSLASTSVLSEVLPE